MQREAEALILLYSLSLGARFTFLDGSPGASIRNDLALVRRRTATLRLAQRSENFETLEGALQAAASAL
jgi:hypothetical protein